MAAFIGQGPYIRQFDRHVKQPITVCFFVQHHVPGRGNVATITERCAKCNVQILCKIELHILLKIQRLVGPDKRSLSQL